MTAKNSKGKNIFKESKIYMPIPQRFGRGDRMGRGPYEKSGIIRDTGLAPNRPVHESFTIPYPSRVVKQRGKKVRKITDHEMTITVELWYMPYGKKDDDASLWRKATKKVKLQKGWI